MAYMHLQQLWFLIVHNTGVQPEDLKIRFEPDQTTLAGQLRNCSIGTAYVRVVGGDSWLAKTKRFSKHHLEAWHKALKGFNDAINLPTFQATEDGEIEWVFDNVVLTGQFSYDETLIEEP